MIEKCLTHLDIFGTEMRIYIQGSTRNKTPFGGVLAIITLIMVIACTWVLGKDIIYKEIPNLIIQSELLTSRPLITMDYKTFPIAIAVTGDTNNVFYDETYFEFVVELVTINNKEGTVISESLELEPCTAINFPRLTNETITQAGIIKYRCLKNQNITIYGFWDEEAISYPSFRLNYCNGKETCKSKDEIDKFLHENPLYWNIFFQNSIVDSQSYDSPIKNYFVSKYKLIGSNNLKIWEMYIQQQRVYTDSGFIFEEFREEEALNFEYAEIDSGNGSIFQLTLFSINLYPSNSRVIYKRRYIKAQSIAANLGGIVNMFIILSKVLTFHFSIKKRNTTILNEIIDFDIEGNEKIEEKGDAISNVVDSTMKNYREDNITPQQMYNLKKNNFMELNKNPALTEENKKSSQQNINNSNNKLTFSFCELLWMIVCPCKLNKRLKNKKLLYNKNSNLIDENLDIIRIIRKFDEFEKMKFVLFNKEQLALFNFLAKKKSSPNEKNINNINHLSEYMNDHKQLEQIVMNYNQNKDNNTLSDMDKNLLMLLDDRFNKPRKLSI